MTEDGAGTSMTFQIVDVKQPLCSVTKLCDRGNRIVFGRNGGVIQNLRTGNLTPFRRQGGVYALDLWVDQSEPSSTGFRRQR